MDMRNGRSTERGLMKISATMDAIPLTKLDKSLRMLNERFVH